MRITNHRAWVEHPNKAEGTDQQEVNKKIVLILKLLK